MRPVPRRQRRAEEGTMTVKRLILSLFLLVGLAGAAFLAREAEGPGLRMTTAAEKLLASLDGKQKAKAAFAFADKERLHWWFTPQQKDRKATRKGLPLEEMNKDQRALALEVLKAGLSATGYEQATTIMSLESILADLEKKGAMVRNPDWYFVTVFGTPANTGKWGYRFEGHHLSVNFTVDSGKVVSATPAIFGANPAEVKAGPRKGLRTLPQSIDRAKALVDLLDADQRKSAHRDKPFPEIKENEPKPTVGEPTGLQASKMNDKQKEALLALIESYAGRVTGTTAAQQMAEVKKAGLDKVRFAYGPGDGTPGKVFTYRVQGPTFVIEFLNEQKDSAGNPANHIHSGWRNLQGDFGLAP